jgi:hypothetical protein
LLAGLLLDETGVDQRMESWCRWLSVRDPFRHPTKHQRVRFIEHPSRLRHGFGSAEFVDKKDIAADAGSLAATARKRFEPDGR